MAKSEREIILVRVQKLEENILYLKKMKKDLSLDAVASNKFNEWSLRYGIFESIQMVIDIACHISNSYNLGSSKSYSQCIENLQKNNFLSDKLAKRLISAIGLRNLLIHEYIEIDIKKLYSFLDLSNDFSNFIKEIKEYIK